MISSDLVITLSNWALGIEKQRATLASENIASINQGGVKKTADFDKMISSMSYAMKSDDMGMVSKTLQKEVETKISTSDSFLNNISIDEEMFELLKAEGRYKTISEALNRKLGLMSIAARSR